MLSRRKNKRIAYHLGLVVTAMAVFMVLVHTLLPYALRHYANKKINEQPGLSGEIGAFKVNLLAGNYSIEDVKLKHLKDKEEREVLQLETLQAHLDWAALFSGVVEGSVSLQSPQVSIWKTSSSDNNQNDPLAWQDQLKQLIPFKIDRLSVQSGSVWLHDLTLKTPLHLQVDKITITASNLTNRERLKDDNYAHVNGSARVFGSGTAQAKMDFDPLARQPKFKLRYSLRDVELIKLNDLLMAYGKFDVDQGRFFLFSEFQAVNGHFHGYVKPLFKNLDVRTWNDENHRNNKLLMLWKNIVSLAVDLVKNEAQDQVATKFEAKGTFDQPQVSIWMAVTQLLRNGFVQALFPGFDQNLQWSELSEEMKGK